MFKGASALRAGLIAACVALPAASAIAANGPATHKCFFITEWEGWSSPSPTVLYLKVNSDIYRVDLSVGSKLLRAPGMHLNSKLSDNASVCTPLDLDLEISDEMGSLREPLIAKAITKLTPEEAAAIPPKLRP